MVIKLSKDFIVEKDGKEFVDVVKILPEILPSGKKFLIEKIGLSRVQIYIQRSGLGRDSKKFIINRLIELDDLFFEALGLWQGEGGKNKGLYFGNSCLELILHFLEFTRQKLGIKRDEFKVTMNTPEKFESENFVKNMYSEEMGIPLENFTNVCVDKRISKNYIQLYINGIVLCELMKILHERFKILILKHFNYSVPYLRGVFVAEGSVLLRDWGTISHIDFSSKDLEYIEFLRDLLIRIGVSSGEFQKPGLKFQIYSKRNFEKFKEYKLHFLHPNKCQKFEDGFGNYSRDVKKRSEMILSILSYLINKQGTYNDLSRNLNKGRSTIQSHYIPLMEKEGVVRRCEKRNRAWLFEITENGKEFIKSKSQEKSSFSFILP